MKRITALLIFVATLSATEDSVKQDSWWDIFSDPTLTTIVTRGLEENFKLKASASKVNQSMEQSKIVRSQLLPSVYANGRWNGSDLNGFQGRTQGSTLPDYMDNRSVTLDARYKLDSWGEELQQYRSVKLNSQAAKADLADAEMQMAISMTSLYFDAIYSKAQMAILKKQEVTAQKLTDLMKMRYDRGEATGLALLQQKQNLAAASASIPPAKMQHTTSLQYLSAITTISKSELQGVISDTLPTFGPEIDQEYSTGKRFDISAALLREESAKANFTKTKMVLIPTVEITGSVGWDYGDPGTAEWEGKWAVGAQVSVPIFTGGAITAGYRDAQSGYDAAIASKEQMQNDAEAQLNNALSEEKSYREQLEAYQNQYDASLALYNESLRQYRNGLTPYIDVLASITNLHQIEITLLRTNLTLLKSRLNVIKAIGGRS